jgi:hypothetical protein
MFLFQSESKGLKPEVNVTGGKPTPSLPSFFFARLAGFRKPPRMVDSLGRWESESELSIASPWRVPKFGKRFFEPGVVWSEFQAYLAWWEASFT